MAKREIAVGATSQTIDVFIQDSSSTTGAGLGSLVFNSAGLTCYYRKGATGTSTQLTLATQTVGGAYSSGGFVEVDGTNMKGLYRLDLANGMVDTAGMLTIVLRGATNMAPTPIEIEVVAVDKFDAVRMGMTALPNADADAAGGLPISDSGGLDLDNVLDAAISTRATPAQVNTEVDTALTDIHLDHLLAATYDPAAKPGVSTALLNELVENDGGVSRYTANALEQAPSAGTNPNVLVDTTVTGLSSQTVFNLTAGSTDDDAYNGQAIVLYDADNSDFPSVRVVSDYVGATKTITLDSAPDFTLVNGDGVKIFVTAPGTSAPTVGQVADAVWDEARAGHVAAGSFGEGVNAEQLNAQAKADVNAEADTALSDYAPSTHTAANVRTEMDSNSTQLAAIVADTNELQTDDVPGLIAALNDLDAAGVRTAVGLAAANLDTQLGDVPTLAEMAAAFTEIKGATWSSVTDTLEAIRDQGDAAWSGLDAAATRAAVGLASANLDTQLGSIQTSANAIETDTQDLQSRLPASLVSGRMDANIAAFNDSTVGVAAFERATSGIGVGTVAGGGTTTSIPTSSLTPAASVDDQFIGRIVVFDQDTPTAALRGEATDITDSTSAGVLTVTALTTAPSAGDTFSIN